MKGPARVFRSGQSLAALLTTLLPLTVSLLLWASHSVAQESASITNANNSIKDVGPEGVSGDSGENKPVLYVNSPQLLREMRRQTFLRHNFRLSAGRSEGGSQMGVLEGEIPLMKRATNLGIQMRRIANEELGVTHMQAIFDELPYSDIERKEEEIVKEMVQSLEHKFSLFSNVLGEMAVMVATHYSHHSQSGIDVFHHYNDEASYNPCCLIPDHYLLYQSHFGTRVNEELWCDSGLGTSEDSLPADFYFPPYNLTEMFVLNLRRYPSIKWQYFMSVDGLHTEYPAHRSDTVIAADCSQSGRHGHVYEATVRPDGKNIVLLYDLGEALTPRLLLTAKAIGHQIASTIMQHDQIAVLGLEGSVVRPAAPCMNATLVPATHTVKHAIRRFVNYMDIHNEPTNHSLGLITAMEMIANWSSSLSSSNKSVLLMYVTCGKLNKHSQIHTILQHMAVMLDIIPTKVLLSAFGLGISRDQPSSERQFLEALAYQEFRKYDIQTTRLPNKGLVVGLDSTLNVAPVINNFYDAVHEPKGHSDGLQNLVISDPYWDEDGRGMVVSLTQVVQTGDGKVIGVIGIDLPLANLLEDITHYNSPAHSYAFATDARGKVLGHPRLGRPESWSLPLVPTDIALLEQTRNFSQVRDDFIRLSSGYRVLIDTDQSRSKREELHYWWFQSSSCGWVFIVAWRDSGRPHKRLSRNVPPLPPSALFHRLDLLEPSEARVCRLFNQMATLDGSTVFLAVGSYVSPLSQVAGGPETLSAVQSITAYLSDSTQLIANPGLRMGVRTDAAAVNQISDFWEKKFENSDLSKYIVRRYAAAPSGVTLMYPGTLLDQMFDPRSQAWYLNALANPGKVVVSAPYLDPGGAGHIITISHTVYQGGTATMHSSTDPVVAVLAADFTLGYWYKLLLDLEPACANNARSGEKSVSVRCFLMDNKGYLVAHPSMLSPASPNFGSDTPPHITHQEPVVSMELLAGEILTKASCGRWWHGVSERHYSLRLPPDQIVASPAGGKGQVDNSCLRYALTAVPATNLILGIINQTCTPAVAFCPCSMDDRLCLNCQLVEAGACECPCECPLSSLPCTVPSADPPVSSTQMPSALASYTNLTESVDYLWPSYVEPRPVSSPSAPRVLHLPRVLELATRPPHLAPTCSRTPEAAVPLQYSIGLLAHLDPCVPVSCATHLEYKSCLGVVGCVWCSRNGDGQSPLNHPHCMEEHQCYGGVLGGPSPYPHGLATLPHSDNTHGGSGSPIGPVAGGIMAVFLVVALAVYCYRQHVGGTGRSLYTPANFQSRPHPIYQPEHNHEIDNVEEDLVGDVTGVSLGAAATISPYRMNPGYRRPPGQADSSDHGYSTMTPHDDSENLNYIDLGGIAGLPSLSATQMLDDPPSSSGWSPPSSPTPQDRGGSMSVEDEPSDYSHTLLPSRKHMGPNIIVVPVIVHMVDTV
ncbi:VWFA and cache domain-containing protein 1-like isoform X1 [Penaeus japonicus]|uniref:VWFA and cache domain-containing protein 1-like isoform X1 n=1 Tax=Penaeus japonicus TaxID=27405 RepID=UPI001C715E98|nr:VWFA and cache domain-containing protein 1-like isoform X1 [Penaeus japonicus]